MTTLICMSNKHLIPDCTFQSITMLLKILLHGAANGGPSLILKSRNHTLGLGTNL